MFWGDSELHSSSGCVLFSQPAICSGDQSNLSFPATACRSRGLVANLQHFGRRDRAQAFSSASVARHQLKPPLRLISRLTVEGERPSSLAIDRADRCAVTPLEITSRSASVNANLERRRSAGRIPPCGATRK